MEVSGIRICLYPVSSSNHARGLHAFVVSLETYDFYVLNLGQNMCGEFRAA